MAKAKRKAIQKKGAVKKSVLQTKKAGDFWTHLAFALIVVSIIMLILGGVYSIWAKDKIAKEVKQAIDAELNKQAIDAGDISGMLAFVFAAFGVLWIIIALLMGMTLQIIEKTGERKYKILLLITSVAAMITGRLFDAGILSLIGSIIYLRRE